MRSTIAIISLFLSITLFGQIEIDLDGNAKRKTSVLVEKNLGYLKGTKTLFVYTMNDEVHLELLKSKLKEVWTITELEFITYDEFLEKKYGENYSFFVIEGRAFNVETTSGALAATHVITYLSLYLEKDGEKLRYCRIELFASGETFLEAMKYNYREGRLALQQYLYTNAKFKNWYIVYLRNALQYINMKILALEKQALNESKIYGNLKPLQTDTLYVPDYILSKFIFFKGDDQGRYDVKELFKNYPYPYKIVSTSELLKIISNTEKSVYYLSYIRANHDKYINVVDGKTGMFLYFSYSSISYNISHLDLKNIAKKVLKS